MYISPLILGHYYLAERNPKGIPGGRTHVDMLRWQLVPAAYDGKIARIPFKAVPRNIWRQAYHILVENAPC